MSWSVQQLAEDCGGQLHGDAAVHVSGVSTDTRSLGPRQLFVAIRGETFDGHGFLEEAVAAGAVVLLVSAEPKSDPGAPWILVEDTVRALGDLARAHRARFDGPVIAITGSNGKTTTKELCAGILEATGISVHRTPGNLNNHIGLPLTILGLRQERALVVEMGMNHPGEIAYLAGIARPDVAAITNVAPAHLGPLGSIDAIARAKGEIFEGLQDGGTAVVNLDDPHVREQSQRFSGRKLTFGRDPDAAFRASHERLVDGRPCFTLACPGGQVEVALRGTGVHLVEDALCAAAAAWASGRVADAELLADALERFEGVPGRAARLESLEGLRVIDDSYNANPASVRAALETLAAVRRDGRAIAVLGDMLELGPDAPELHASCGQTAAELGVDVLVGVGPLSVHTCRAARAGGVSTVMCVDDAAQALGPVRTHARSGDVVLVKGSRAMKLEHLVRALMGSN
jgi:UDP-N-acetylmuramoyl-tripeptide--D-alanyl-D-alanine ligase